MKSFIQRRNVSLWLTVLFLSIFCRNAMSHVVIGLRMQPSVKCRTAERHRTCRHCRRKRRLSSDRQLHSVHREVGLLVGAGYVYWLTDWLTEWVTGRPPVSHNVTWDRHILCACVCVFFCVCNLQFWISWLNFMKLCTRDVTLWDTQNLTFVISYNRQ